MFDHIPKNEVGFIPVPQNEDVETLLSHSSSEDYVEKCRRPLRKYALGSLFLLNSILTCLIGIWIGTHRFFDPDDFCARRISQFSPLVEDVGIHYHIQRYNGSFMKLNAFRQPAGPDVDAAWDSLGTYYRAILVPDSLAEASGLHPTTHVHINPKYGGGYPANVEGLHHLHCLNLLRKSLYNNYAYYHDLGLGAFSNDDLILDYHITHCLDILRQQLMCTVDVGVLGQVWTFPDEPRPFVDFNTDHQCRNFEAVRSWAESRQLPKLVPPDFLERPGEGVVVYDEVP